MEEAIKNLIRKVQLPYQVTQISKEELSVLEKKFYEISDKDKTTVIKIAEEVFDSEMPPIIKEERWFYCLMYGIVEFLDEHYQKQANKATAC